MGTNTSKIKEIIYVSSADLDPPDLHRKREHKPEKEIDIRYGSYGSKSYFRKDASEVELERHLEKVEKKEKILRQFKHHKDFDRIDFKRMDDQVAVFQTHLEESIKTFLFFGLLLSRIITLQYSVDYYTTGAWRRLFWPCLGLLFPILIHKNLTAQEYHILNHEYFRLLPEQQSLYIQLDQNVNLFKDVEDIKYNYKYSGVKEYYKTRRYVLETARDANKNWYKEYYQYKLGLKVEPLEEFAKMRQGRRKGNWEGLSQDERRQIEEELSERQKMGEGN